MMKKNGVKTKLIFRFLVTLYLIGFISLIYLDFFTHKKGILSDIDLRLYNIAVALKYILPDDFHDRAIDEQAISIEEDMDIVNKFNDYIKETGIKYTYTIIKKNEKLFFVASDVITDPKEAGSKSNRDTYYFYDYTKEADKSFFEAFNRSEPTYQTVSDQWGEVRTVMIPETSPGGIKYLACADYDIGYLKGSLQKSLLRLIVSVSILLFLSTLIIALYSKMRNQYFKKLKLSEKRFRTLVGNIPGASYRCRNDTFRSMLYISDEIETLCGYPPAEFLHNTIRSFTSIIHPEDQQRVKNSILTAINRKDTFTLEYRILTSDGTIRWVHENGQGVFNEQDKICYLDGVIINITDRKRAEEEKEKLQIKIQQAQKLESLGVLASGIAHDFNNLLTAILGNAELTLMEMAPESPARKSVEGIKAASLRAAELTRQMLAYSGKGKFVVEVININTLIEEMWHMLEVSISKRSILKSNYEKNIPAVSADATQIRQVIMNLIINASEAIGEKNGVITISTGLVDATEGYISEIIFDTEVYEGYYVFIEVSDTGCGMDDDTINKLFDPFFTTKFTGRGLGLSAVQGIVRGHNGALKIYSEPDKGTTFKILLPCLDLSQEEQAISKKPESPVLIAKGTALVVDDEESVRSYACMALEQLGFNVLSAKDGREGVEALRKYKDDVTVVLLDMTMPHMDGKEAFREMKQIKPEVSVILTSGYNEQEATSSFTGKGLAGFIQKPFKLSSLKTELLNIFK